MGRAISGPGPPASKIGYLCAIHEKINLTFFLWHFIIRTSVADGNHGLVQRAETHHSHSLRTKGAVVENKEVL